MGLWLNFDNSDIEGGFEGRMGFWNSLLVLMLRDKTVFMSLSALCACWSPRKPEEGVGCHPATGVADSCELPCGS